MGEDHMITLSLEKIQDALDCSMTADTIAEKLETTGPQTPFRAAIGQMVNNHFDVLGLRDANGHVRGYVELHKSPTNLTGTCREHCKPFDIERLVSLHTPLKECILRFKEDTRLFVLGTTGVDGIITAADLHKQPVRMFLFSIISLLEMTLSQLIKDNYSDDAWCDKLPKDRLNRAKSTYNAQRKANHDLDLVHCIQLRDKVDICASEFWHEWGFWDEGKAQRFRTEITELRNGLAHAQEKIWSDINSIISNYEKTENIIKVTLNMLQKHGMKMAGVSD